MKFRLVEWWPGTIAGLPLDIETVVDKSPGEYHNTHLADLTLEQLVQISKIRDVALVSRQGSPEPVLWLEKHRGSFRQR